MKKLYKGLKTDTLPNDQEEGSWRDANNIVISKKFNSISNEDGVDDVTPIAGVGVYNYPTKPCIGFITTNSVKILFFGTTNPADSELGKINANGTYSPIIKNSILNFNQNYPIQGTFDNKFNNNTVISWRADNEKPRILNIDCIPFTTNADGTIPAGEVAKANILLSLFPDYLTPILSRRKVNVIEGAGSLLSGVYYPIFSYGFIDGSFTGWSKVYNGITVYQDDKSLSGNQIGGCEGGLTTNKYIKLDVTNIDVNFEFLKIGYLYVQNGSTFAYEVKTISINNINNHSITLTGTESTINQIPLEEVLVPQAIYERIKTITNFQGNLAIANLKEPDEIDFQTYANLINVEWFRLATTHEDEASNAALFGSLILTNAEEIDTGGGILYPGYKNETTVFFDKSFKAGECYALYITFKLTNGGYSKDFHIPGRDVLVGDRTILNPLPAASDLNDLDNGNDIYKYQIYDTSVVNVSPNYYSGKMGFWENENEEYPLDPNNALAVHPKFANIPGISVANRKVRHHVFPDVKTLVSYFQNDPAFGPWGPGIPNFMVSTPSTMYTENRPTSSVVPTGANNYYLDFGVLGSSLGTSNFTYTALVVPFPKAKFNAFTISSVFNIKLSFNQNLSKDKVGSTVFSLGGAWAININIVKNGNTFVSYNASINTSKVLEASDIPGQTIDTNINVGAGDTIEITYEIYTSLGTASFTNPLAYSYIFSNLEVSFGDPYLLYGKPLGLRLSNINIPPSLIGLVDSYEIRFAKRTNDNIRIIGQDIMKEERLHNFDLMYSRLALKPSYLKPLLDYNPTPPTLPLAINNIPLYASVNLLDENVHVTNEIESVSRWLYVGENTTSPVNNNNKASSIYVIAGNGQTTTLYLKNKYEVNNTLLDICIFRRNMYLKFEKQELISTGVNIKITASGVQPTKLIFGGDIFLSEFGFKDAVSGGSNYNILAEFATNVSLRSEDTLNNKTYFPKSVAPTPSYYGYNKDFNCNNSFNIANIYYPLKECLEDITYQPQRVSLSIKDGSESVKLNWRVFKINSYYDMPKNKGVIWNILASNRMMYIHTEFTLFIAEIRDRLATTTGDVYLGISDIFDRPPIEVLPISEGYAGTQSQFACIICKFGYCFIDRKAGKVFIYKEGQGLKEISSQGMYHFFKKYSQTFLDIDNPFINRGYMMGFDDKFNRLIISKNEVETVDNGYKFCLSYSNEINQGEGGWVSFHDYNPNALLYNRDGMFAIENTLFKLFKHNSLTVKSKYYNGVIKDSYIDYVENEDPNITKRFDSLTWISNVDLNNVNYKETFTHLMIFNDNQCSGIIDLNSDSSLWFSHAVRDVEGTWNFNEFRDLIINSSNAFLDSKNKLISTNIDVNKSWFEQSKFISKYAIFRLIYNNVSQKNLHLTLIGVNFNKSTR